MKIVYSLTMTAMALSFVGLIYLSAITVIDHNRLMAWDAQYDKWIECHHEQFHTLHNVNCKALEPK